jgi:CubicO group peptidase (beta-lactamase class C family)
MKDGLFKPLKMDSAGFGAPGTPLQVDQPWGHTIQLFGASALQSDNPRALGPAGTIHASVPDWAQFASLHLAGARGSATLLDLAQIQHLQTPPTDGDYACGWAVYSAGVKSSLASSLLVKSLGFDEEQLNEWTGGRALLHNGSNTLWLSWLVILPKKNLALMVVTNEFGPKVEKACGDALRTLMEHHQAHLDQP